MLFKNLGEIINFSDFLQLTVMAICQHVTFHGASQDHNWYIDLEAYVFATVYYRNGKTIKGTTINFNLKI